MKEKKNGVNTPSVENLSPIGEDSNKTNGKVSGNFSIVDDSEVLDAIETPKKNEVFALVADYFCPVTFDDSLLRTSLQPLVDAKIMSEEVFNATLSKAKKEFLDANKEVIEKSENLSFSEVIAKLKENPSLYAKVLNVCNITELTESNYIQEGKVTIYRANQCTDKEGNNRYFDVTLKSEVNGKTFEQNLFVEKREISTSNIILAIRYFSSKQDAQRRLLNQIQNYKRVLSDIHVLCEKAKENGFSKEQILSVIDSVF